MIISRYLAKEILHTLVAITVILLFIFSCNVFVRYLGYVATGKYAAGILLKIVMLQIPILLGLLLPLGLYLGILLGYGRLYAESEMTVLFACGFSQKQLLKVTLMFATSVVIIVAFLSLWIQPIMTERSRLVLADAKSGSLLQTVSPGRFQSIGTGGRVFYVEQVAAGHQSVKNVFVAQKMHPDHGDNKSSQTTSLSAWGILFAKEAHEETQNGNRYMVMTHGHLYKGTPGQNNYDVVNYAAYGVRTNQASIAGLTPSVDSISTEKLLTLMWLDKKYMTELQWRLSAPLSVILLAIIALPMSQLKPRQGKFSKILPAILLYIVYVNLLFVGRSWLSNGVTPGWLGLWWIHVAFLLVALSVVKFSDQFASFLTMVSTRKKSI